MRAKWYGVGCGSALCRSLTNMLMCEWDGLDSTILRRKLIPLMYLDSGRFNLKNRMGKCNEAREGQGVESRKQIESLHELHYVLTM